MPAKDIDYTAATTSLASTDDSPIIVATKLGNAVVEIQGELVLPQEKHAELTPEEEEKFSQLQPGEWAVRFGKLQLEDKKATLFIGTTQRLLGDIKKIDPPLALMRFPHGDDTDESIEIVDVLKWKIVFNGRPLPIM